jgi:thioester reductase-like protein
MTRSILFTGFPGFIGARLVPRLLEADPAARVVALVEPRMEERALDVAGGVDPDRIEIVPGDITHPRLGLDSSTYERLTGETVAVHHLAAVYDLAVPAAVGERVNVVGTAMVLDFCRACPALERHNYVSTAYVAGLRTGDVREEELDEGQEFKNHYESTKFAAEALVRSSMEAGMPTTVYRPAIVVGDSRTGETQKFDGPYYMLRAIRAFRGPLPQLGNPDALFNTVPVDFVVDALAAGAADERAAGRTLHLVDPEPLSSEELYTLLARELDGREPSFRLRPGVTDRALRFATMRKLFGGTPRESLRYLNHPVRFDASNASEILAAHGLRCPRFSEYVDPIVRFFREHEDDPDMRRGSA